MDDDTPRLGIRPLMHEPNRLWPSVFRQHQVWVDINGTEHEIESMPVHYVENVIGFCIRRAVSIYLLAAEIDGEDGDPLGCHAAADDRDLMIRMVAWLETTPLMRALRRRLEPRHPQS
jgi:hypothetical protein